MSDERMTALITGAAGGIGRALVKAFVRNGYQVIATDIVELPDNLSDVTYHKIDLELFVNDPDYASAVISEVKLQFQGRGLKVLINNAAIQILGGVDTLSRQSWRKSLDVNLIAPFLLTQALLKELELARGGVINISSIHSRLTKKDFVAYATTKAALSGMTRAMAVDLGARVRVNAIEPAAIDTSMLREGLIDLPNSYKQLEACHPQARIGHPDEVAQAAVAIADDRIGFLHGACIPLDGGMAGCLRDPIS